MIYEFFHSEKMGKKFNSVPSDGLDLASYSVRFQSNKFRNQKIWPLVAPKID
jgi:hypothetical protein